MKLAVLRLLLSVLINGQNAKIFFAASPRTVPLMFAQIGTNCACRICYLAVYLMLILCVQNQRVVPVVKGMGGVERLQALRDANTGLDDERKTVELVDQLLEVLR